MWRRGWGCDGEGEGDGGGGGLRTGPMVVSAGDVFGVWRYMDGSMDR